MKIVIDTNVLMAALLKDSTIRKILSSDKIKIFSVSEILKFLDYF